MTKSAFQPRKIFTPFTTVSIIFFASAIISCFYLFYIKKDFDFIVETDCDPNTETCFYRDCGIVDECPPNNLSYYNEYTLKAKDFQSCPNEDCMEACASGTIECIKTECTEDDIKDEICVVPILNIE